MGLFCWMLVSRKIHVLSPEATKVAQLCSVLEVLNFGFRSRDKEWSAGSSPSSSAGLATPRTAHEPQTSSWFPALSPRSTSATCN